MDHNIQSAKKILNYVKVCFRYHDHFFDYRLPDLWNAIAFKLIKCCVEMCTWCQAYVGKSNPNNERVMIR